MLKILILMAYWDRPNMIRKNALQSIKEMNYENWELAFIDDGSDIPGRPVVEEVLKDHLDKIKFFRTELTMEDRMGTRGSMHGWYMNHAVRNSDADIVVVLCDDDALCPDYFTNINKFFTENPSEMWGYCHIIIFDPTSQDYHTISSTPDHSYNHNNSRVAPACTLDSSQVIYRAECTRKGNVEWLYPITANLDQHFYTKMVSVYGLCPFMGCVGQYKGIFKDQMGKRLILTKPEDKVYGVN